MLFEDLDKLDLKGKTVAIFCPGPTLRFLKDHHKKIPADWPRIGCSLSVSHPVLRGAVNYWCAATDFCQPSAQYTSSAKVIAAEAIAGGAPDHIVVYSGPPRSIIMALHLAHAGEAKRAYVFGLDLYRTVDLYYFGQQPKPLSRVENQLLAREIIKKRNIAGDPDRKAFATPRLVEARELLEATDFAPLEVVVVGSPSSRAPFRKVNWEDFEADVSVEGESPDVLPAETIQPPPQVTPPPPSEPIGPVFDLPATPPLAASPPLKSTLSPADRVKAALRRKVAKA